MIQLPSINLVGITTRTSNKREMDEARARIGAHVGKYHGESISDKILHKTNPSRTICAYTRYASDAHGDYTYFIGQEVSSFDGQDEDLALLEGELEESDLPYKVDIVDYNLSDPTFQKVMDKANICIQEK